MSKRFSRAGRAITIAALLAVTLGAQPAVGAAGPSGEEVRDPCTEVPEVQPGIHVRAPESTDVTGGFAAFPPRNEFEVEPGGRYQTCVGFQNRTGREIDVRWDARNVGASGDPEAPIDVTLRDFDFGAAEWVALPTDKPFTLQHGDIAWLDVVVNVPADALAGSNYAAVAMEVQHEPLSAEGGGASARLSGVVTTQLFFDVPGDVGRSGKIDRVRSPKVIWWDGFDLARVDALERLRGLGIGPFTIRWRNTGELSEELKGRIVIRSFTGREVKSLPLDGGFVLRGGSRDFRATWTDPPIIGRFTPTLELTGRNGEKLETELDPIWVIPAWWYIALVVIAIVVPTVVTIRRRRRMRALIARLEAAEAGAGGSDADDDSWSEDEGFR